MMSQLYEYNCVCRPLEMRLRFAHILAELHDGVC